MPKVNPTSGTTINTLLKAMYQEIRYVCPRDIMPPSAELEELTKPIGCNPRKRDRTSTRRAQSHRASTATCLASVRMSSTYPQRNRRLTQEHGREFGEEEGSWMEEVEYRASAQFSDFPGWDELQLLAMSSNPLACNDREAINTEVTYSSSIYLPQSERHYSAPGPIGSPAHDPGLHHEIAEGQQSRSQSPKKPNFASQVALYDVLEQQKIRATTKRLAESSKTKGH